MLKSEKQSIKITVLSVEKEEEDREVTKLGKFALGKVIKRCSRIKKRKYFETVIPFLGHFSRRSVS